MRQRALVFLRVLGGIALLLGLILVSSLQTARAASKYRTTPAMHLNAVGNNTSDNTPSIYNFYGPLYVAWQGTDQSGPNGSSHINIIQSSDGITFTNKVTFSDTTDSGVQMTAFNGHLYLAWVSSKGDGSIYLGWYDTTTHSSTLNNHTGFPANACSNVGMASFNGLLYLAYEDCSSNNYIDIAYSSDGINFTIQKILHDSCYGAPALLTFNGQLYIAWSGTDSPGHIYLGTYPGSGPTIGPLHIRLTDLSPWDMGIAPYNGELYLAWHGYTNRDLFYGYFNNSNQLANDQTAPNAVLEDLSGPAICLSFGHLYAAWTDYNTNALELARLQ
jgi:hypothetical protein